MSNTNPTKGQRRLLLVRNDADTEWNILGGIETHALARDIPVETTTNSGTASAFNESAHSGFAELTITASGKHDKRAPFVKDGYTVVASARINEIIDTKESCWKFRIENIDTGGFCEGFFNITSYNSGGGIAELTPFDISLQTATETTMSGEV